MSLRVAASIAAGMMFAATAVSAAEAPLCANDPFMGTWKLNNAKTKSTVPFTGAERLVIIAPAQGGLTRVFLNIADIKQVAREEHYTGKFDGKDYQSLGGDPRLISMTRPDCHTILSKTKRNGKETSATRMVVSADGKTLSMFLSGTRGTGEPYKDDVQVYDRQ